MSVAIHLVPTNMQRKANYKACHGISFVVPSFGDDASIPNATLSTFANGQLSTRFSFKISNKSPM